MNTLWIIIAVLVLHAVLMAILIRGLVGWNSKKKPSLFSAITIAIGLHLLSGVGWAFGTHLLIEKNWVLQGVFLYFFCYFLAGLPIFLFLGCRRVSRIALGGISFGVALLINGFSFDLVIDKYVLQTSWSELGKPPTLRGFHTVRDCPNCNGELVIRLFLRHGPDDVLIDDPRFRSEGVCSQCWHTTQEPKQVRPFLPPDHYSINHLRSPERWSTVVFSGSRDEEGVRMIGRLVGMPGETIQLVEERLVINGKVADMPPQLSLLRYPHESAMQALDRLQIPRETYYAHQDQPLTLGPDEFFVLTDNPCSALDSRLFGPCLRSTYLGVVDLIYWPPDRWKLNP